jgi:hypothetical protein
MFSALLPATTMIVSVNGFSAEIAAESRVPVEGVEPAAAGGQGSMALSLPMRLDAPAERITPHILHLLPMGKR